VLIEVPIGGDPVKYEFDKTSGALFVDRIPHTLDALSGQLRLRAPDALRGRRPLDCLVMARWPLMTGSASGRAVGSCSGRRSRRRREAARRARTRTSPIMRDQRGVGPARHRAPADRAFFTHYKDLEPEKWVRVGPGADARRLCRRRCLGARPKR
jgi:inorganic pyrophosphatase